MEAQHLTRTASTFNISAKWSKIWQILTQPGDGVPDDERRRASFLATLTLIFLVLNAIGNSVMIIIDSATVINTIIPPLLNMIAVAIAYGFSRTRYYKISAYIVTYASTGAVIGIFFVMGYSVHTAIILVIPVLFSGLVLGWRATLLSGFISMLVVVAGYILIDNNVMPLAVGLVTIVIAISGALVTYTTYQRSQYLIALQASKNQLENQVIIAEQAREHAERSDQVKSAFLASMSHELRTPLNAIINFTRFVVDGDTGPVNEQQSELLTEVVGSAKHLLNLINDVLDMSKIESGSLNLFIEDDVSLNALLRTTLVTGQSLLLDKPVRLEEDIQDDLPLIRGDKQRIFQVLLNIVSNACKFTEEGEITVRAQRTDDEIVITVRDTGPGIAPEDQDMVFEAFKQTSTGLRQAGGTGLGMPIARSLAEAHGGRLWLESEYGNGATFYFSMPIKSDELVPTLA